MIPLKIRYRFWFLAIVIVMALFLMFLSLYTQSNYRLALAIIWLVIGLNNWRNNSVLDVTSTEIMTRNGLGIVTKRYAYQEGEVEVRDKQIFFNKKKIYSHSITFLEEDFEKVREYLTTENPELNLIRHLVPEDED
jgi:hypothetical protein